MLHVEQLHAGAIDVGFVRPPLGRSGLDELVLGREPLVCVLPKGHRLARRGARSPRGSRRRASGVVAGAPRPRRLAARCSRDLFGEPPWPQIARTEPEEERIVSAVAEGGGVSFIMLERSRSLRVPGAVYRRFAAPEPTMGIALAWRRGDTLPALLRLRDIADAVAHAWAIEQVS